jgi:cell wall-associated NlpC family hydrolase
LSRLLALALIFTSPQAFSQATSKESKSKTTSQTKSQTGSGSTKSKTSGGTKSQSGTKSKPGASAQKGSQSASKKKSDEPTQTNSQTASKTNAEAPAQAGKAKASDQPEDEASAQTTQPSPSPSPSPSASPAVEVSSLKPEDLRGFYNNPPEVQELLTAALELTERNLGYEYGSADPERGGMDCSGTIYFLLQKMGVSEVPRSASQQYVWVRKSDGFKSVVSTSVDSFELDALKPGDLLFWTGTYSVNVDPPVTHTMIYLGRARSDGRRLMVGASDGRTFRGAKKYGVSVFDFVIPKPNGKNPMSRFIGYAQIPR